MIDFEDFVDDEPPPEDSEFIAMLRVNNIYSSRKVEGSPDGHASVAEVKLTVSRLAYSSYNECH